MCNIHCWDKEVRRDHVKYGKDWGGYLEIWKIIARRDTGSWERYWDLGEILGSRRDTGI